MPTTGNRILGRLIFFYPEKNEENFNKDDKGDHDDRRLIRRIDMILNTRRTPLKVAGGCTGAVTWKPLADEKSDLTDEWTDRKR